MIDTPGWPGALHVDPGNAPNAAWVSVTPFGLDGPRSTWKATDLGVMASTGNMYCTGDPDRPPVRCTEPTAWAHVGPETAFATLTAIASGRPQRVDVSAQEVVMIASMGHAARFPRTGNRGKRSGANIGNTREIWPCADGFVSFGLRGGRARVANLQTITRLVDEDGLATPALTDRDWTTYDHTKMTPEELEEISAPIAAYFERHKMAELYEIACETNLMLAPANSPRELVESKQLAERDFFCTVEGLGKIPRSFVHVTSPGDAVAEPGAAAVAVRDVSVGARPRAGQHAAAARAGLGAAASSDRRPAWSGTTIIEFGTGAAGPIAVRYFAEHGAKVIRIESRTRPDFLRTYGSNGPYGLEGSDMFDSLNVGKLGVTLNLKHPEGVGIARKLIGLADAVAENFAPRAMRGFGLDYAALAADKPSLVMVSSCLQGQTGPHRDYPGFGGQGSALGGYNILTGWPDREPIGPFGTITDSLAPRFVATALAAGLLYNRRTGNGVYLDVSQAESAVYSLSPWIADYTVNGRIGIRQGNRSERFSPHGVFPCKGDDRWVAIACFTDGDWQKLAGVLGIDERGIDRDLDRDHDQIEKTIAEWTSQRDATEVAEMLQGVGHRSSARLRPERRVRRSATRSPRTLRRARASPHGRVLLRTKRLPALRRRRRLRPDEPVVGGAQRDGARRASRNVERGDGPAARRGRARVGLQLAAGQQPDRAAFSWRRAPLPSHRHSGAGRSGACRTPPRTKRPGRPPADQKAASRRAHGPRPPRPGTR